jgi:hypothetical protein
MCDHLCRVARKRLAGSNDAELQPARGWNKFRYGMLGAGNIEQTGDVGAIGLDPARSATDRAPPSYPSEAVADGKTRFIDLLAKRVEALFGNQPDGIRCRLE